MLNELITTNTQVLASPLTTDLMSRWIRFIDAKPRTVETYTRNIKQFFIYLHDNGITQPVREDIISYRDMLKATHKPATIQAYITTVKLFFQWTESENLYPDIAKHVKGAKIDTDHKRDSLTIKQVRKILASVDTSTVTGKRDYAILFLMATTGLRTIEIERANIADLRTRGDDTVLYVQGKGHDEKNDYVKIEEHVEAAIRDYLAARDKTTSQDPLFASHSNRNNGERMTTRSIRRLTKDTLIAAGLNSDRLTAHSFRHTAATLALLNGSSLEETQQLLRHSKISTTMIYAHALDRAKNNSEIRIANAILG